MYALPLIVVASVFVLRWAASTPLDDVLSPEARARRLYERSGAPRPERSWSQW